MAPTKQISTSVGFQDAKGNLVANGFLKLVLSQNAEITSGGGQVTTQSIILPLDANAKITTQTLWFTDELTPSGLTYHAYLIGSNGLTQIQDFGPWAITGASADLSLMTPTTNGPSYPTAIITNPTAQQTINGQDLVMEGASLGLSASGSTTGDVFLNRVASNVLGVGTADGTNAGGTSRQAIVQIGGSDTGLSRISAGVIGAGNGTQGDVTGTVVGAQVSLGGTTASFPALARNGTTGTEITVGLANGASPTGAAIAIKSQNTDGAGIGNSGLKVGGNAGVLFSGNALSSYATLTADASLSRTAASTLAVGNGTLGNASGTLKVATIQGAALQGAGSGNAVTLLNTSPNAAAITGNSTAQNLFSYALPANMVGAGKGIRIKAVTLHNSGTAGPTYALKVGSTTIESFTLAPNNNTQVDSFVWEIFNNAGVQNSQFWNRSSVQNQTGSANAQAGAAAGTSAVDLSSAQTITWSFNVANTDQVTPKCWSVELIQ